MIHGTVNVIRRELVCDEATCGSYLWYDRSWWSIDIRTHAKSEGWTRPLVNGKRRDLCPSCSKMEVAK